MKPKMLLIIALIVLFMEGCNRAFTPYEAANRGHGRRGGSVR